MKRQMGYLNIKIGLKLEICREEDKAGKLNRNRREN